MSDIRRYVQRIARRWLGDYTVFVILVHDSSGESMAHSLEAEELIDLTELASSGDTELAELTGYAGPQANCFVFRDRGTIVAGCWVWYGDLYRTRRNYWRLNHDDAKLIALVTRTDYRGRGIASQLIRKVTYAMHARGFQRLFARVWHSNAASIRAFEKATWRRHAIVVTIRPRGTPLRIEIPYPRFGAKRRPILV